MASPSRRRSTEKSSPPGLSPCHAQKLKSVSQCQEGIMKLSLLGTAGCLDRAADGPWSLVVPAFFQPIAFVRLFIDKNAYRLPIAVGSMIFLFLTAGPAAADPYKW